MQITKKVIYFLKCLNINAIIVADKTNYCVLLAGKYQKILQTLLYNFHIT